VGSTLLAHGLSIYPCLILPRPWARGKANRRWSVKKLLVVLTVALLCLPTTAMGGGGDHYPNGVEDFLAGMAPPLGFYVINYNYFYFSHDSIEHNRGRALALGPGIRWDYKRLSFVLKTQYEFGVKNRPQGKNMWFKIAYKFL